MAQYDFDLIIIGGGSGGATAAMGALSYGKKPLIIEKEFLGGTCTNVGCVPSKTYLHAADLVRNATEANNYGLFEKSPSGFNFESIKQHKERIINNMRQTGERVLKQSGIEVMKGTASLQDPHTVSVDGKSVSSENILIAAGTTPFIPPINGLENVDYLDSTSALAMEKLPESIIIVGGSYIGLEFATFYNTLGVKTTVVEVVDRLAKNEDEEIAHLLTESLIDQGIEVAVGAKINQVNKSENTVTLEAQHQGQSKAFSAEKILIATGRVPNYKQLNLDAVGVKYGRKGIEVNEYLQTNVGSIYAIGDIISSLQLEHVAVYEGGLVSKNMFYKDKEAVDYRVIPRVMFSYPEVASVGETEEQASSHARVVSASYPYAGIAMAQMAQRTQGLIKLVVDAKSGYLLGAHIVGASAGELIHLASTAMRFNISVADLAESISAYPTYAKGFYHAANNAAGELALAA